MPTPAHTRVTFSGIFGTMTTPIEIWSVNLNAEPLTATTPEAAVAYAGACRQAWATRMADMLVSEVILTRTRVATVNATGHVNQEQDGRYQQGDDTNPIAGTNAATDTNRKPPQTALVATLTTSRPGATGKGRVFLPYGSTIPLTADYRIAANHAESFAAAFEGLVEDVGVALGQPLVVASSKGYLSRVTGIRVGRTLDTMRSRRSKMPEAYVSRAVTMPAS